MSIREGLDLAIPAHGKPQEDLDKSALEKDIEDRKPKTYDAFVSYSHAADGKLAPALQRSLERFGKPWYRRRALRCFRDQTNLSASPELWPGIESALDQSGSFVLLASPEAARSKWVKKEIAHWLATKSHASLLVVLTSGRIVWDETLCDFDWTQTDALPREILSGVFATEPLWADLSFVHEPGVQLSLNEPRFSQATLMVSAAIQRRPMDEVGGEAVREHRRTRRWVAATISVLGILVLFAGLLAFVAWWQWGEAEQNLATANRRLATAIWNDLPETSVDALPVRSRNALWQLAAGRSTLAAPFLDELASAPDRPLRFGANVDEILRAINGPSGLTSEQARTALVPVLDAIPDNTDREALQALVQAVAALAPKLSPEQAQTALVPVLDAIPNTTDTDQLAALEGAAEALAPKLGAKQVRVAPAPVLNAISNTIDKNQLAAPKGAAEALAPKLGAEKAEAALAPVLNAISNTTDADQLAALARAVEPFAPKLEADQAQAALVPILNAIPNTTDQEQLEALARAVEAFAPKLEADQAQAALITVLEAIPYSIEACLSGCYPHPLNVGCTHSPE